MIAAVGGVMGIYDHNAVSRPKERGIVFFFFCLDGHPFTCQPRTKGLNIIAVAFLSQAAGLTLLALGIYTAKYGTGVGAR